MKKNHLSRIMVLATIGSLSLATVQAQTDGTWQGTVAVSANTSINWDVDTNWLDGVVADGAGAVATLSRENLSQTGGTTVTVSVRLNTSRTLGGILATGSPALGAPRIAVNRTGSSVLTLDSGSSTPAFITNEGDGPFAVSAPILLNSSLELTNNNSIPDGTFLTLSGGVSANINELITITTMPIEPRTLNYNRIVIQNNPITDGEGTIAVVHNSGDTLNFQDLSSGNTFSGGLTIKSGEVRVTGTTLANADDALGAAGGTITFDGGRLAFTTANISANSNRPTIMDAGGGTISVTALGTQTVVWNGNIEGEGAFAINVSGVNSSITLGGSNTYEGGTVLTGRGTVATDENGTFGTGNVTLMLTYVKIGEEDVPVSNTLTLGNAFSLDSNATLTFTSVSTINLNFEGTQTLGGLALDTTFITPGLYNATQLNDFFGGSNFTGTGYIQVVPEPGTWVLLGLGAAFLAFGRRFRRS